MIKYFTIRACLVSASLLFPPLSFSAEILFTFVSNGGPYVDDGQRIANMVDSLPGYNVTQRFLNTGIYTDYANFDQVWVYDLFTGADNNANQLSNYQNIANWFSSLTCHDH